jgi:hypothetical protein
MSKKEKVMWEGRPSQLLNIWWYFLLLMVLIVSLFNPLFLSMLPITLCLMVWNIWVLKNLRYEITNERVKISSGVINKIEKDLELYRVNDIIFEEPWYLRIFKMGKIVILTNDISYPIVFIKAIRNAKDTKELLRLMVENRRKERGISEVEND